MTETNFPEKMDAVFSEAEEKLDNLAGKSLAELSGLFQQLQGAADKMARSREAEAIKSAFYKLLGKLKSEAGTEDSAENPFESVEQNFKAMYADYKRERAEFNKEQEARREENLAKKQAIIGELKTLIEKEEDVSASFPAFRELQNRWREAGPVPVTAYRDINDTYQHYVEQFYDLVKINRDLRDLDFRKNLEAKEAFCAAAEKLAENENVVEAFHELQKLHDQWKEYGPVAKEKREDIWNRFKAATAVINKKYQAHFEGLKEEQAANLAAKTALCEEAEAIAQREVTSSAQWNGLSKELEDLQARWRKIGFATKKENQRIYERFRAACDKFFERKRAYYADFKGQMSENLEKKLDLIAKAEALKDSTEWKKTADQLIALQKQWKEIGSVPRKKSEQLWTRFRAACDAFFEKRDENARPENDFYGNLRTKRRLVEEIQAYALSGDEAADAAAMRGFAGRWQEIGHVPFKEKDAIAKAYRDAMQEKFPRFSQRNASVSRAPKAPRSPKDLLVDKYHALQQELATFENNIGFFSNSKGASPLIAQMQERILRTREELQELERKIKEAGEGEN